MAGLLAAFVFLMALGAVSSEASLCPYVIPEPPYIAQSGCLYGCCTDRSNGCCDEPFYQSEGFIIGMGIGCPILAMIIVGTIIYFACRHKIKAKAKDDPNAYLIGCMAVKCCQLAVLSSRYN
ncbi:hypothetical protein BsWGS_22606 [Bradybaena similaris]